jgi:hypothetical protein
VIAMIAVCWHFAYGVWLFAAKWGITPGEVARKRFGYVCVVLGVVLAGMGIASIWAFVGPKFPNAPENVPVSYQRTEIKNQNAALHLEGGSVVAVNDPLSTVKPVFN